MTVTLYLDVYFAVNMLMDFLLLYLVKRIWRLSASLLRLFAGAGAGAFWSCAAIWLYGLPPWIELFATWLAAGAFMVFVAFGRQEKKQFIRCLITLWLVSAAVGGIFAAVGERIFKTGQWTFAAFGFGVAGLFFLGRTGLVFFQECMSIQNRIYDVTLYYEGRTKMVRALLDTGNRLYEPYGHQPVHVLTGSACRGFCERTRKVIYIPFCSVGTEHGILPGIRMERIEVRREGKLVRVYEQPWVAISRGPLSPRHQYDMLLHEEQ